MDVFRFINSSAIRDHLREIDYKFSGFEAAWLVSKCRTATLEEKQAAWREIIETYPDEEYKALPASYKTRTLHSIIKEQLTPDQAEERDRGSIFAKMEFDFPVPFHAGDILYDPKESPYYWHRDETFVYVDRTTPLWRTPGCHDIFEKGSYCRTFSALCGRLLYNNGEIVENWSCMTWQYMSFEYCPEEKLTGVKRIAKALSSLVIGDITEIQFAKAYAYLRADEHAKKLPPGESRACAEKFARILYPDEDEFTEDELRFAGLE